MSFFRENQIGQWVRPKGPLSLTIGNFDGIHIGHRSLIECSTDWAKNHSGKSMVLTFEPHPMKVLAPQKYQGRLFDLDDQWAMLESLHMNGIFVQAFSQEFAQLSAAEFLENYLWKNFNPDHIVVGHDFAFGKNRGGGYQELSQFCKQKKIKLDALSALKMNDEIVSSSVVRSALVNGDPQKAMEFLGRPFSFTGQVDPGAQRGGTIGFPTANLRPTVDFVPATGVYATRTLINSKAFNSVTNVGTNPTVDKTLNIKIETHIFNFSEELYGQKITVEFHHYLRPEKKFSGLQELKDHIAMDVRRAKELMP